MRRSRRRFRRMNRPGAELGPRRLSVIGPRAADGEAGPFLSRMRHLRLPCTAPLPLQPTSHRRRIRPRPPCPVPRLRIRVRVPAAVSIVRGRMPAATIIRVAIRTIIAAWAVPVPVRSTRASVALSPVPVRRAVPMPIPPFRVLAVASPRVRTPVPALRARAIIPSRGVRV